MMFEQIAALENESKTPMIDSEKIAIVIEKLPLSINLCSLPK